MSGAGRVVNIRVNPKDCMSCIDVVKKTGLNLQGASFSLIVSAALSSALESFRQHGLIPNRDGFEFTEMMQNYPARSKADRSRALAITETFKMVGSTGQVPAIVPADPRKRVRFEELAFRNEQDPNNLTDAEKDELAALALEVM